MPSFKSIFRDLRGMGSMSRRGVGMDLLNQEARPQDAPHQSCWANLPPELLFDVIRRVEASEISWPARKHVVACASVCRSWRQITKEIVKTPEESGRVTFPFSLKQPGPRDSPMQCFIKRDRATSTYSLYLGLSPALVGETGKLLFAARKIRHTTSVEFVISLVLDDFSRTSSAYIGKLRSNFFGTKFTIYDSLVAQHSSVLSSSRSFRRIHPRQVSPRVPAGNHHVATISYDLNILRTRGPRRMQCTMHSIPITSIREGGTAPTPTRVAHSLEQSFSLLSPVPKSKEPAVDFNSMNLCQPTESVSSAEPLVLKNKAPRWHDQLQCWCLNFRGRVTVASVKNFQLVPVVEPSHQVTLDHEKVILQFGKIGKDIFTMDYRYPLSAFQAFAICLSSFDTKPIWE
ncbi:tubby-like F-box protein 5 [Aristolochia californica]|uniref:tubby-like F-box protein 5 n=1 Tax=Aristolochia californica TaxID=171875 RepID=UPI0035E1B697